MTSSRASFLCCLLAAKELRTTARRTLVQRLVVQHGSFVKLAVRLASRQRLNSAEGELVGILRRGKYLRDKIEAAAQSEQWLWAENGGDAFPDALLEIPDPPLALTLQGQHTATLPPAVAIVGARRASPAGRETARTLAQELARCNIVTVSGLALGIDAAAHEGAIAAGGITIAVFGSGLDHCYPPRNRHLAQQIVHTGGLLVSEYPPWEHPLKQNFPARNRIISGLSLAVVVVEATTRSGSLITARMALEQGRDVMAVPGPRASPLSKGCHRLLRQGAVLVEDTRDILEALNLPAMTVAARLPEGPRLSPIERKILTAVDYQYTTVASVAADSQIENGMLLSTLLALELKGLIASYGDGYIRSNAPDCQPQPLDPGEADGYIPLPP